MILSMRDAHVVFARQARFRRHLRRLAPVLSRLRLEGRSEPNVLAILAVESFYRPGPLRLLEYVAWAVLSVLPARHGHVSVGMAQIRLHNLAQLGLIDSTRFSLARLDRIRGPEAAYEACSRYLSARDVLSETDPEVLARAYAGGQRPHFATLLAQARENQSGEPPAIEPPTARPQPSVGAD